MSRIRSIHPGLFTDDTFVVVSDAAQIFYIGLLTESDDNGVFEWNPVKLKMRLRGNSKEGVEPLLEELTAAEKIASYELNGRKFGLVRNFRKFQRPKKPHSIYLLPDEWRTYVGLTDDSSPPDANEEMLVPQKGENPPQMEEEGEGGREGRKKGKEYAFECGVIRLVEKTLSDWKKSFSYLDVPAELTGIAKWASEQESWFNAVCGLLAKRNREAKLKSEQQAKAGKPQYQGGIEGII